MTTTAARFTSLDVFRGMTIFFMIIVNTPGSWTYVYSPLLHAKWHGCTPTDLVFPSFLFVIGLAMAISFKKYDAVNRKLLVKKILKRTFYIFLIGLLLNWFPFYNTHISDLRIFGVLQRIALAFMGAGLLIAFIKKTNLLVVTAMALMLLHWAILFVFGGDNPFSLEGNIGRTIDLKLLGETHLYGGFGIPFDPEGLLGTLSSIAQVIIGFLLGKKITSSYPAEASMVKFTVMVSVGLLVSGYLIGYVYPINKPLWTGSYVLYTSGIIGLVLALLIWIIDVKKQEKWTYVFKVYGLNPLISYIMSIFVVKIFLYLIKIDGQNLYAWLYEHIYQANFGNYFGSFLFALSFVMFIWLFAYALYRKGKIIKV